MRDTTPTVSACGTATCRLVPQEQVAPAGDDTRRGEPPLSLTTQLRLLDLPIELLCEVLWDAPLSLGCTCRCFRTLLNSDRQALRLCRQPSARQLQLSDLTALLRRLPLLTSLHGGDCDFTSLPFFTACPGLQTLTLGGYSLQGTAILALTSCQDLTSLSFFGYVSKPTLDGIAALVCLRSLHFLNGGDFTSAVPLAQLSSLTALHLQACGDMTGLDPLTNLTSLASLTLKHYPGHSIAPLSACGAHLTFLDLSYAPWFTSLCPLSSCTCLVELRLDACYSFCDFAPLALCGRALTTVSVRHMWQHQHLSLAPLAACTSLTHLDICRSLFESVAPLAACVRLIKLRIARCRIPLVQLELLASVLGPAVIDTNDSHGS